MTKAFRSGTKKAAVKGCFVMLIYCLFMYKNVRFVQVLLTFFFRQCYNKAHSRAKWDRYAT